MCWHPSSAQIAAGMTDMITIFDAETGIFSLSCFAQLAEIQSVKTEMEHEKRCVFFTDVIVFVTAGHATHRLLVDRAMGASKNKEVVVWSVGYLSDHTIISGDSAGKVQIWNGLTGTLVRTYLVTKWDVLVLSVSKVR